MAEKKQTKKWYFVAWEERHPRRPYAQVHNDVTDEHPVTFLLEARRGSRHRVSLLFWTELDVSASRAASWRKQMDDYGG